MRRVDEAFLPQFKLTNRVDGVARKRTPKEPILHKLIKGHPVFLNASAFVPQRSMFFLSQKSLQL